MFILGGETMNELSMNDMEAIDGGGFLTYILYIAIGGAIYKIITSNAGRLSIPNIISIEWR